MCWFLICEQELNVVGTVTLFFTSARWTLTCSERFRLLLPIETVAFIWL